VNARYLGDIVHTLHVTRRCTTFIWGRFRSCKYIGDVNYAKLDCCCLISSNAGSTLISFIMKGISIYCHYAAEAVCLGAEASCLGSVRSKH
jgi:hypothetical protein